jgi:transcriptional regulator with XRE-family HTH domain
VAVEWTPQEIKSRRIARGWDQNQLAAELGVSRRAITNWETGNAEPRGENRRRLDTILGDTPQPEVSLQGASDAQFIAEMARRLAQRDNSPTLPAEDLWWPRAHPQGAEPLGDRDVPGAQQR